MTTMPEPRDLMHQLIESHLNRREFVRRAAALGFSAPAIAGFLAACGRENPPATNVPASATGTAARATTTPVRPAPAPSTTVQVGPVRRVSQIPHVFEPHIAIAPTNPERLAAIAIAPSAFLHDRVGSINLMLAVSTDGGVNWQEQKLQSEWDGVVGFGPDGTLYAVGQTSYGQVGVHRAAAGSPMPSAALIYFSSASADKPWLTIDHRTGTLYVPYTGPNNLSNPRLGIVLQRSTNGGTTWSAPLVIERGVDHAQWRAGQAIPPGFAQALFGEGGNVAIAWTWSPGFDNWPLGVWLATSNDGGQTFTPGKRIAETWGFISTASHQGIYYITYRRGTEQTQQLVMAISRDGGATWQSSVVSGDLILSFDLDKAPGIDVAPDGTIDVIFYGEEGSTPLDMDALRNRRAAGWVDPRRHNVYYTYSKDGGQTFSSPLRLNTDPIVGAWFVRTQGYSRPGEYMGMASTDTYAHPIWIDTPAAESAYAVTTRIRR